MGLMPLAHVSRLWAAPDADVREVKWDLTDIVKLVGLFFLYQLVAGLVFDLLLNLWRLDPEQEKQLLLVFATWGGIALVFLTHGRFRWWPDHQYFGLTRADFQSQFKLGVRYGLIIKAIMIACSLLVVGLIHWLIAGNHDWMLGNPPTLPALSAGSVAWLFRCLDAVIVAPVIEELLFRGMFYTWLTHRYSLTAGRIISSLVFAALHGSLLTLLPIFLVGFGLVLIYERTRSLAPCVVAHATGNLVSAVLAMF